VSILSCFQTLPIFFKVKGQDGNPVSGVNIQSLNGYNIYSYFENSRDKVTIAASTKPTAIKKTGDLHVAGT
jgi:hypothetical protein